MSWKSLILASLFLGMNAASYAEPISYQGQLLVNSAPANGIFDLECRLFNAIIDGDQIGETAIVDDLLIVNGLLNTRLDFGDAFDASAVYLEISIRNGETEDPYEVLTPRKIVDSAPKAIHALTADSVRGPGWSIGESLLTNGDLLTFGAGNDRVLINRDELVNPIEFFGVHISGLDIGSIVISNEDEMKSTMFAHVTGGVIGASEVFNGETRELTLQIDGENALVASATEVSAPSVSTGSVVSGSYAYENPVAGAVTVAGDVFHSAMGTPFLASVFSGGAYITDANAAVPMVAPITLPHNAMITKFTARFEDNAATDLLISLKGAASDGSLLAIADLSTMGSVAGIQSVSTTEIVMENSVTDTLNTGYYIRIFCPAWPGDSTLRIWSVTVEYTVDAPN